MFIVAMTLAIIASMGVYAMQLASTEVKSAGYVRQQAQTQYLAEFGVATAAQAINGTIAQVYNNIMMGPSPDTGCYSLYGITATGGANTQSLACHRAGSAELQAEVGATAPLLRAFQGPTPTSDYDRGSVGINTSPDFYVEVTDPNQRQPPPGFAVNSNLCFTQFTASAIAITPVVAGGTTSEGLQIARARIIGGPITCTGTN